MSLHSRASLAAAALLLVAAPSRAETLKVPADFNTIQSAVDAAAVGDTVLVSKGIYRENVQVAASGITLKGKSAVIDGTYSGNCLSAGGSDVTITGFTLVNGGGEAADSAGDGEITGGLLLFGTGYEVTKVQIRACEGFGIAFTGNDSTIEKVDIEGCGQGIIANTLDAGGAPLTVSKCHVLRCGDGFSGEGGPFVVEKSTFEDNLSDGISIVLDIKPDGASMLRVSLVKNECLNNAERGIALDNVFGNGSLVEKNVCSGNGIGLELIVFQAAVSGNTVEHNRAGGVFFTASSSRLEKNKVRDNGLLGVLVSGLDIGDGRVGDNDVLDNDVSGNCGDGMDVVSTGNLVSDNTISDNLGDGVQLSAALVGNRVLSNKVLDNGHDGIDNDATLTLISHNVCKGNGGADLAGVGSGPGTTDPASFDNLVGDGTGLTSEQELELATL